MRISLLDNQINKPTEWKDAASADYKDDYKEILDQFNEVSLQELQSNELDETRFLVFPSENAKSDLDQKDRFIYKLDWKKRKAPAFQTGNVMGFMSLADDLQMQITSRFDKADKNFFLHYMLQKVCNVALTPKTDSLDESILDFLYYLFPGYLKEACSQGIYRAYVKQEYNDANIRGPIDVAQHIRYNTPFNGKIAYHTREYTTNNKVTQLIRHTIEYIRSLNEGGIILESDGDVRDDVSDIIAATPTYSKNSRLQVIAQNLSPVTHPYYTAYEPLRKLCLAILRHDKLSYGTNANEPIRGILFDGAALWEEYLAKVFEEQNLDYLTHPNNRKRTNGIQIFENGRHYYPDFYSRNSSKDTNDGIIIDAKYKYACTREDYFQMIAYMHALKISKSVLISPNSCEHPDSAFVEYKDSKKIVDNGGEIFRFKVPICPNVNTFADFCTLMKSVEKELANRITETIRTTL
jgi:5-methylcytosine-specific restriction endonuclease McrBC regulatory subunit McrC